MSTTTWYLRPKPGHTSTALGREVSPEDECRQVLCADGKKRNLYRSTWGFVDDALNSAKEHELNFTVWKQEGNRPPVEFNPKKVFRRRSKKVQDVVKQLGRINADKVARS